MSETPIIPGFHPDPSICRRGDDYYLVTSSFEYLPGIPLFHSRDLVSWELIANVLDRPEQLTVGPAGSGGIFAPTIRYHAGRFWIATTNFDTIASGHLIVWSTEPSGPWSASVFVAGTLGIDPDLFWDADGVCYLSWASFVGGSKILQAAIDPETGEMLSEPVQLWTGSGLAFPEGPHIFRRGAWYYLLLAEGGTERGHAVTIARSRSLAGPYEGNPANPILTHRSSADPVQNTGHADLVETVDGGTAMVYLGVRPVGPSPGFHLNGRETFLAAVTWEDGWPVVDEGAYVVPARDGDFDESFGAEPLDPRWISPGIFPAEFVSANAAGGILLHPVDGRRSLLAVRVEHSGWDVRASVQTGTARLVLRLDDAHWVGVESGVGVVSVCVVIGPVQHFLASARLETADDVTLVIRSTAAPTGIFPRPPLADTLELGFLDAGEFRILSSLDGRYLSTEVAGGFTGRVIGVEPIPSRGMPAVVRRFGYSGV